jgi:hypothetical protein
MGYRHWEIAKKWGFRFRIFLTQGGGAGKVLA